MRLVELSLPFSVGVIVIAILLVKYYWKLWWFAFKLQGPSALPFVGNALTFLRQNDDILNAFLNCIAPYSSPTRLWLGPRLVIIVKDADQLQVITQSSKITTKAFIYKFLRPFLGNGLFTSTDPTHKTHRKMLQPLFSQRMLEGYTQMFQKHAGKFVEQISKHCDGPEFDIMPYLHYSAFESTMDILVEDKNDHSIDYKDIPHFVRRFYDIVFTRLRHFWLHSDFLFRFSKLFKEQSQIKDVATRIIEEIMNTRLPEIVERVKSGGETGADARVPSVLEMMIEMTAENPESFSSQECIDHMMTFIAASQDTQSSAIAFTCLMLGAYPERQQQVVDELQEVLGDRKIIDLTDASKLKFLEMCIKESMRLYPVAPYVFRDTTEDFQLGDLTIPRNVTVALGLYNVHRDPTHWEKPLEFFPEHFTQEAVKERHPFAFLPFSAGPRKCIAQIYSYVNMKVLIANVLLHYELECKKKVEDIQLTSDISIRPIGGYMLKIKKRVF